MWQGWKDEEQRRIRVEQECARVTTLLKFVRQERDELKKERDELKKERDELEEKLRMLALGGK
jgi:septal ring factor EnvC (AmiA/AmiB activator)